MAQLAAGEHLALPDSVVGYLDRLRALGVDERYIVKECDAWIVLAAQLPDEIDAMIEAKVEQLDDPDVLRVYRLVGGAIDCAADDPRLAEIADLLARISQRGVESGAAEIPGLDDHLVEILDAAAADVSPAAARLFVLLEERGWKGLTRIDPIAGRGRG